MCLTISRIAFELMVNSRELVGNLKIGNLNIDESQELILVTTNSKL